MSIRKYNKWTNYLPELRHFCLDSENGLSTGFADSRQTIVSDLYPALVLCWLAKGHYTQDLCSIYPVSAVTSQREMKTERIEQTKAEGHIFINIWVTQSCQTENVGLVS